MQSAQSSILETIGNTPIIPLKRLAPGFSVFAKYEAGNPTFSVKDRIAYAMIQKAQKEGKVTSDTFIVDATAGNTGVALALVCAVLKLKLKIFMPEDASLERRKMFQGFGAQLELTPKAEGVPGAVLRAKVFLEKNPQAYSPHQFDNPENPLAHARTTAEEIVADFPNGMDALVVGVGTGGTLTGVGRVLRKKFPQIRIYAVEPAKSAVLSGKPAGRHRIQQLGLGFIPHVLDRTLIDEIITIEDEEAYHMTRKLSECEGVLVGISSGANVAAALKVAGKMGADKKILTFLCDAGQRYFSLDKFFKEEGTGNS